MENESQHTDNLGQYLQSCAEQGINADEARLFDLDIRPSSDSSTGKRCYEEGPGGDSQCDTPTREDLVSQFGKLSEKFISRCHTACQESFGWYVSQVLHFDDRKSVDRFCDKLCEYATDYRRRFMLIGKHDCHVHISHDCAFSNGTCRCLFIEKAKIACGVRSATNVRKCRLIRDLELTDWEKILFYFSEERRGRRIHQVRICGRVEELPRTAKDFQLEGIERYPETGSLEVSCSLGGDELRSEQQAVQASKSGPRGNRLVSQTKRQRRASIHEKILEFAMDYPCSPITNVVNHPKWCNDKDLRFMRADNKLVKDVLDNFMAQLCTWNIYDFYNLYTRKECYPSFSAGFANTSQFYYDVDDSLSIMFKLLEFQFNNDYEVIACFAKNLYNVLERNIPKCNSFLVHSPPSAGKNFFFDVFIDFYLNKGQLGRANRHNTFAFQDAFAKRIIVWNEPNYETAMIDTLKMMLGGDAYNINVKYKTNCGVFKTPVLILTNQRVSIMTDPAFKDRMIQYKWQAAPFLKQYDKKLNPLACFAFFKYFNLVSVENKTNE